MRTPRLTHRQHDVLRFIAERIRAGRAPTHREVQAHFGWRSHHSATLHIYALEDAGCLTSQMDVARSLKLTDRGRRLA